MRNSSSETAAQRDRMIRPFIYADPAAPPDVARLNRAQIEDGSRLPQLIDSQAVRDAAAGSENHRDLERQQAAEVERQLSREREAVAMAIKDFATQRERYFMRLERDVVQLALAVARKVLQREAQQDPMLLAGAVRVALDQLAPSTKVELVVPPSLKEDWEELIQKADLSLRPQLRTDPSLEPGGCRLETEAGSTDLSLELQMTEIERGFTELLARRTSAGA